MTKRSRFTLIGALVGVVIAAAAGIAIAAAGDDDQPLEGSTLDRAIEAALAETGGGEVLETEIGDDGAAYGVEVRLDDGRVVEVNLDADFQVIDATPDDDGAGGTDDDAGTDDDGAGENEDDATG